MGSRKAAAATSLENLEVLGPTYLASELTFQQSPDILMHKKGKCNDTYKYAVSTIKQFRKQGK